MHPRRRATTTAYVYRIDTRDLRRSTRSSRSGPCPSTSPSPPTTARARHELVHLRPQRHRRRHGEGGATGSRSAATPGASSCPPTAAPRTWRSWAATSIVARRPRHPAGRQPGRLVRRRAPAPAHLTRTARRSTSATTAAGTVVRIDAATGAVTHTVTTGCAAPQHGDLRRRHRDLRRELRVVHGHEARADDLAELDEIRTDHHPIGITYEPTTASGVGRLLRRQHPRLRRLVARLTPPPNVCGRKRSVSERFRPQTLENRHVPDDPEESGATIQNRTPTAPGGMRGTGSSWSGEARVDRGAGDRAAARLRRRSRGAGRAGRPDRISVVGNRADLVSGGNALVDIALPAGVDASDRSRVRVGDRDVTGAFAVRPNGRCRAWSPAWRSAPTSSSRERRRLPARAAHDHEPPDRRPGVLRVRRSSRGRAPRARSTRSATARRPTRSSTCRPTAAASRPTTRRTRADRRRHHHDRPGQDGAVHRPPGDRRHRPRRVPDRGALRPGAAVGAVGAAARVQRQARHHPRRQLRHVLRDGLGARRAERGGAGQGLRRHVARPRQRRPQLQHRHPGRVAGHDQGARRRDATARSATRSAAAAPAARSPSSRSPTRTRASTRASRRRAATPTRGPRPCSTSTTTGCSPTSRTRRSGRRARCGSRRRSRRCSATRTRRTRHVHDGDPELGQADPSCPGVPAERRLRRARPTPTASAARCTTTCATSSAPTRRPASPSGRPTTSASCTASRACMAGTLLPQQFVDVNTKIGGVDVDYNKTPERSRRRRPRPAAGLPQRRRQHRRSTSTRSRSSTCAAPTPARSTTCTARTRCASGCSASTAPPTTRCCGGAASPILGRHHVHRRGHLRHGPLAGGRRAGRPRRPAAAEDHRGAGRRPASSTAAPPAPARTCRRSTARPSCSATPRPASPPACRPPTTCSKCALKPLRRADFPGVLFTDAQWQALQQAFPTGVCDYTKPDPNRVATDHVARLHRRPGRAAARRPAPVGAGPLSRPRTMAPPTGA